MTILPTGVSKTTMTLAEIANAADSTNLSGRLPSVLFALNNAGRNEVDTYTFSARSISLSTGFQGHYT